ncbi:Oidioi.mRNA.OKI2018_I69.XSR.g14414.t1.cds [Oikopleura dioica]|uniref:Oidioi.mRNA.OKI2018_I69.XSR.g14414.t1.cds n=1 Tax=Oikopleura dioica TaxID=34765 RepID=A0ABN7SDM7_OIKDI|nr:Oidioi.mRNA.OKI2018_I69.XSR.g14414.t1.cds [Oikopleura dioica]
MFKNEKGKRTSSSYKVSVIGCSGPVASNSNQLGGDSDLVGIGKSSFCARFMYPDQDEYSQMDKRSIISSVDFASGLINYHHTLWWGTTTVEPDEKTELSFSLLEQTVFVDDSSLKVFDADKLKKEPYEKRCAIEVFKNWRQKKFKGFANFHDTPEHENDKMPDKFKIDAFLLLIDVSKERHDKQPIENQLVIVEKILKNMKDIKKTPVVVALTKYDKVAESPRLEDDISGKVKNFFKRPEIEKKLLKQREVPIIETSADENVNISETFQVIASLVDKRRNNKESRKSVEVKPFRQAREEVLKNEARINEDFKEFLKENLVQYETTYKELEKKFHPDSSAFKTFVRLFGTSMARKVLRERVKDLKNLYHDTIIRGYKHYVDMALGELIADSFQNATPTWDELIEEVKTKNNFNKWFITLPNYDAVNGHNGKSGNDGKYWYEDEHVNQTSDIRIPIHVLTDEYAGELFKKDTLGKIERLKLANHALRSASSLQLTEQSKSTNSIPNRLGKCSSPSIHSSSTNEQMSENDLSSIGKPDHTAFRLNPNRWCWNGDRNNTIKILFLSQSPIPLQKFSESLGTGVEIFQFNESFSKMDLNQLYPPHSPNGIMAVYSDGENLQFCKNWLTSATLEDDAPLKAIPVSLVMNPDHDMDPYKRQRHAIDGSEFFNEINGSLSAGFFFSPPSNQQLHLPQKMKEFVHELANLPSIRSSVMNASTNQKLQEVSGGPLIDESSIVLGVCAPALDKEPSEIFQKYLSNQAQQLNYGVGKYGPNWLQIDDIIFEFFEFGSGSSLEQPDVSHVDGLIFCFSKLNGLQSCAEFFSRSPASKKPFQLFQSTSSHSTEDSFQRLASEKFGEVKYEIIRSSQLLSPLLTKEQQNEARLDRKFEEIINAAKASKSIGRMFSDGTVETLATPDSTFSTLDKNSNFGSSSISVESSDAAENVRDRAMRFNQAHFPATRSKDQGLENGKTTGKKVKKRRSKANDLNTSLKDSDTESLHDMSTSVAAISNKQENSSILSQLDTHHSKNSKSRPRFTTPKPIREFLGMEKSQSNSSTAKGVSPFTPNPLHHGGYSDRFFRRELGDEGTFENLEGPDALVPVFLKVIVTAIESSSLDYEGLYRVPADSKKRSLLLKHFDETFKNSSDFDFGDLSLAPNTLAGCVSWFLSPKNLPSPIIPESLQEDLVKAIAPTSESAPPPWERIRNVLLELPVREKGLANWHTLRFICRHLYCVSEKSEINKMSCRNLATCLCPTFFPLKDPSQYQSESFSGDLIEILICLIEHHDSIFRDDPKRIKLMKQEYLRKK